MLFWFLFFWFLLFPTKCRHLTNPKLKSNVWSIRWINKFWLIVFFLLVETQFACEPPSSVPKCSKIRTMTFGAGTDKFWYCLLVYLFPHLALWLNGPLMVPKLSLVSSFLLTFPPKKSSCPLHPSPKMMNYLITLYNEAQIKNMQRLTSSLFPKWRSLHCSQTHFSFIFLYGPFIFSLFFITIFFH